MTRTDTAEPFDTDVLIVGAGPTGLALATVLRRAGQRPLVVERLTEGQNTTSRAAVLHAHTLEVLESIGVSERLWRDGLPLTAFSLRDRDQVLVRLRFDTLPTRYACLLMLPQDRTERILADALREARGEVSWGTTVEALAEAPEAVIATLSAGGRRRTVRARYVVGADGMASIVRRSAQIGFTGSAHAASFVLADVDMRWGLGREEVMLFFSPQGPVVVAPLPGDRYRVVAALDDAPEQPDAGHVQAILDERGPGRGLSDVQRVHWSSRFRLHHRLADHYRRGRYLLVGDAAHVHSPAGGQGMNTGLVDACVLGRMLAEVLCGRRPDAYLDRYEPLRRPAAKEVLALAGRLTGMAMLRHAPQRSLRNAVLRLIGRIAPARRRLQMQLSGLSRRPAAVVPDGDDRRPASWAPSLPAPRT